MTGSLGGVSDVGTLELSSIAKLESTGVTFSCPNDDTLRLETLLDDTSVDSDVVC